jgi:hypothetical protein
MLKLGRVSRKTRGAVITGWVEDLVTFPPGSIYPLG